MKGWYGNSKKHSLASKGIRSSDEFLFNKSPEEQAFITRTMTPCIKCGEWVNKAHISDVGLCNMCNTMARGIDEMFKQVKQFKFPIKFEIDEKTLSKYDDFIKEMAEGDKEYEKWIRKKLSVVKINQREFFDYTGLNDEYWSFKDGLKWEYKDYKDDMKGYGMIPLSFKDYIGEELGLGGTTMRNFITEYVDDEIIEEALYGMEDGIKDDLLTWVDI